MNEHNEHIAVDDLYAMAFDGVASSAVAEHLAACSHCRQELEALRNLAHELEIARRSEPDRTTLEAYRAMFKHVQVQPSLLQRVLDRIRAALTWDSRQQPMLQGVRGFEINNYRQVYRAKDIEIELMVERTGRLQRVEGELLSETQEVDAAPLLLELLDAAGNLLHTVECKGHFRLDKVAPGTYRAVITQADGPIVEIDPLEIA
uniref:Zinc-finger domain-containing protein n=1 Tax=Caldilinea aerophila TaxID=133453 RepID=A0A7C1JN64_9CHLR